MRQAAPLRVMPSQGAKRSHQLLLLLRLSRRWMASWSHCCWYVRLPLAADRVHFPDRAPSPAAASREQMAYNIDCTKATIPEALEVLADAVLNPKFQSWEVAEQVRGRRWLEGSVHRGSGCRRTAVGRSPQPSFANRFCVHSHYPPSTTTAADPQDGGGPEEPG